MTTIYFIRHAEPDFSVKDDKSRPLTNKGLADRVLVTAFLSDKNISTVLSSPFKRAHDTVAHFAKGAELPVRTINDFRERKVADEWILPFEDFTKKQWEDFLYALPNGECLADVQARNIAALERVLREHKNENIAIGTHGTALSTIIHHYDDTYGFAGFSAMMHVFPWVVKMEFDGTRLTGIEKYDLFIFENFVVGCEPLMTFSEYKYTVIFAREAAHDGSWQWLYSRHKQRDTFETPGGRIEPGETPLECAKRELYEETGATKFSIYPAFDYTVHRPAENGAPYAYGIGQVFMAEIEERGSIPNISEMAEVVPFSSIPEPMTYPGILPVLFTNMQRWLTQNTPDEFWDLLDENRTPLGVAHKRGKPKPAGTYHLIVRAWLVNSNGECLITRRSLEKLGSPGLWEVPSGSANAGEISIDAAFRELEEETGIEISPKDGVLIHTERERGAFWDNWLFRCDFDLADVKLQESETIDARAVTLDEIENMVNRGEFVNFIEPELTKIRAHIKAEAKNRECR